MRKLGGCIKTFFKNQKEKFDENKEVGETQEMAFHVILIGLNFIPRFLNKG